MKDVITNQITCPACLAVNDDFALFCAKCNLKFGANLNPLDIARAEGDLLGKAAIGRPKPIVLFIVWLIFLPMMVIGFGLAFNQAIYDRGANAFIAFWFGIFTAMIGIYFLYTVTKNYFTMKEKKFEE